MIVDIQQSRKLLRLLDADAGLDRDRTLHRRKDGVQKSVQPGGVPQHPGSLALGRHRAGGTAEVQVDLRVAQLPHFADHPGGQFAVSGQQLRDHDRACIGLRGQLRHLFRDEDAVFRRRQERRIVARGGIGCAKPFLVHLPPDAVGQPLHRGNVIVHRRPHNVRMALL